MNVLPGVRCGALAVLACLASCNVGFDPVRLERLEYGMERTRIAAELASDQPAIPLVRCFVPDDRGRVQDVLVEFHEALSPHPCYLLVSVDGRLASATFASWRFHHVIVPPESSASSRERAWQPVERRDHEAVVKPWRTGELQAQLRSAEAQRLDLAWSSLGPLDAAQSAARPGRGTTAAEATLFVLPMLLYPPFWLCRQIFGGEGWGRAEAMRERLLAATATTTREQLVASLGEPDSERTFEHPEGVQRVLVWQFGRFTISAGFVDERFSWADFGHWKSWVHEFME